MKAELLLERLNEARKNKDDFRYACSKITKTLPASDEGLPLVGVILDFMEENEELDYGMPGALTHFSEKFYRHGYEKLLLESVSRHPTAQTLFMLNRLINGTTDPQTRDVLIGLVKSATNHPLANSMARELAEDYVAHHEKGTQ